MINSHSVSFYQILPLNLLLCITHDDVVYCHENPWGKYYEKSQTNTPTTNLTEIWGISLY